MSESRFDLNSLYENGPERRVELIGGKVMVGGSLVGSRALLGYLLASWGLEAGVALLDDPRLIVSALDSSEKKDEEFELPVFEPRSWLTVNNLRQNITMGLFRAAANLEVFGRDIVMRIGENAPTPDAFIFRRDRCRMTEYYLDGAAEICAEFLPLGHINELLSIYLAGGVKECWLFDTKTRSLTVLEAVNRNWRTVFSGASGTIQSRAIPGVSLRLPDVFEDRPTNAVRYSGEQLRAGKIPNESGVKWGTLAFHPKIALEPVSVGFDEFISWAPESKFESYDGRLVIGSDEGSRNMLGMLLMTLGLQSAVWLFPAEDWKRAAEERRRQIEQDAALREQMLTKARRAANILKESFKTERVALYGDYFSPVPINFWSRVSLVYWGERENALESWHNVFQRIENECGKDVDFKEYDSLTEAERGQVEENCLML